MQWLPEDTWSLSWNMAWRCTSAAVVEKVLIPSKAIHVCNDKAILIPWYLISIYKSISIYLHWITGTEVKQLWTMSLKNMAWCTQAVNCTSATWSEVLVGSRPIRWQGSDSTWWPNTPLEKWSNSTNARLATRLSKIIICSELISNKHTQRWQWHNQRSSSANSAVINQGK